MKLGSRRLTCAVAAITVWCLAAAGQDKPQMSEQVFKNVQVLKGIPVDDFLGTMGLMSAGVGFDCSECHEGAGTDKVDWAADTPKKMIARNMVTMVGTINRTNFSGRQVVSCWTCHRGRDRPPTVESFEAVYGPGPQDTDYIFAQAPEQPSPNVILDKYIQAVGGAQRLAGLTSYTARGTSIGFGGLGGGGQVQIFAQFPDRRTTLIQFKDNPGRGDSIRSYNGRSGWIKTPLTVLGEYELTGGELDGARLDAQLSFPGQIKEVLTDMRVGPTTTISDLPGPSSQTAGQPDEGIGQDREVNVVQGNGRRGVVATLYFDKKSGLLLRVVRSARTPIGRVPTQIDFADYRDVGGIKFPFRLIFAWLDGRDAIQLNEIKTNVPIEATNFERHTSITR
jgi:photosynthetic reaction center cytochrome c subunit